MIYNHASLSHQCKGRPLMNHYQENLIYNALDFLKTSIKEINTNPKYSIVHLAISIELILKARLSKFDIRHIIKDKNISSEKIKTGNFQSTTLDETITKLLELDSENKKIILEFKLLANEIHKHRNKIIHFYHYEFTNDENINQLSLEPLSRLQYKCLYYIKAFYLKELGTTRKDGKIAIAIIDALINQISDYLSEISKDIINNLYKNVKLKHCYFCKNTGVKINATYDKLEVASCVLCGLSQNRLSLNCIYCNSELILHDSFTQDANTYCTTCGEEYINDNIKQLLKSEPLENNITNSTNFTTNCSLCEGDETVICFNNGYLCIDCFSYFEVCTTCLTCNHPFATSHTHTNSTSCYMCED